MTDLFRIYIHLSGGHWIDVSTKQAIIYGAGQGCLDFMSEMLLPNISYIIDSDKNKWDREIELLNVVYKIQSPFLLASLNLENYYIIISSNENEESIKKSIEMYISKENVLICNRQTLFFCYKKIKDMFYFDPLMKKKILLTNMSFAVENVISIFKKLVSLFENITIDYFMPLREGESKLTFLFGNERDLWVFSIPGYHSGWEKTGIERDSARNRKIRFELRKRMNVDREITVYEDENGVLIQKYVDDYVDFSKEEVKRIVLDKCYRLHQTNDILDIQNDMINQHYISLTEKVLRRIVSSANTVIKIKLKMEIVLNLLERIKYAPQICHGDLLCTNIVGYKDDLFFIDWEYMAMGDAMFDVCRLLFSMKLNKSVNNKIIYKNVLQNIYATLRQDLDIYFKRKCSDEEYLHAVLVMLIFECRELYESALLKGYVDMEKTELLINRIEKLENHSLLKTMDWAD